MSELQPDQAGETKHPRENYSLLTHEAAEATLFEAMNSGRMHHAWLICGPKNVGKATLAYRLARRYLGALPSKESPLESNPNDIICQLIAQNACPDLRVATRYCPQEEKVKSVISVAAIRELIAMFDLKATNQMGRRVAIVDCADDLNSASANAILKTLEEPPKGALIILICNSLGKILPTIRSRCQLLNLRRASDKELKFHFPSSSSALVNLAQGCVGRLKLLESVDADKLYEATSRIIETMPNPQHREISQIANIAKDPQSFDLILTIIDDWLARAISATTGLETVEVLPGESINMVRIFGGNNRAKLYEIWKGIDQIRLQVTNQLDKSIAISAIFNLFQASLAK